MRLLTVLGTRPEIIRLSLVIEKLDTLAEHVVVHTGQNDDERLSDVFFNDLGIRAPDVFLGVRAEGFAAQAAQILERTDEVFARLRPDRVLILGDTNSGLSAIAAARRGIPVFHMEAGNRCYDDRVPEEINRRLIDHSSSILMPYTHRSKENLLREGFPRERIFVIGNPIFEVLAVHEVSIARSSILNALGVAPREFFLATMHRAENVDDPTRLGRLLDGLARVGDSYEQPVIVSLHPRTADKMRTFGLRTVSPHVRFVEPLGFFDFVALERHARCVLTDSGTVQEECCIFHVPNVTIRDTTERAETIECGSNMLTGSNPADIARAVNVALAATTQWSPPPEYVERHVSTTVVKIVLGYTPNLAVGG